MKAKLHLFKHRDINCESIFFKDMLNKNTPIYFKFPIASTCRDFLPCDLLAVHKPDKFMRGDICLVYDELTCEYSIDKCSMVAYMSDIYVDMRDVFIGYKTQCVLDNVQKIIVSTIDDELPFFENELLCEFVFKYNTNLFLDFVDIETVKTENTKLICKLI